MLKLAVSAQLPMVAVVTRDKMNLHMVLKELTGCQPLDYDPQSGKIEKGRLYTYTAPTDTKVKLPLFKLYEALVQAESTLVIVNPREIEEPMFDAGEVPVPRKLMLEFMENVVVSTDKALELLRGLGGCTIREAAELARLTMARDKSLTLPGIMNTRKSSFQGQSGLIQVDLEQSFYEPPLKLKTWVASEKQFFLTGTDPRLIPRGLLMDGPPGTGKTAASKWIAQQFGVPLYRVDIGGTKGKYVGQSENQMLSNLTRLDNEEPCIALLDEVEKVFGGETNDGATTSTMLSQLLWWLAERRSRVLVVMTTNASKKLPKELYREGRVDEVMWFGGLEIGAARDFVKLVMATFGVKLATKAQLNDVAGEIAEGALLNASGPGDGKATTVSQAALTQAVVEYVKLSQLTKGGIKSV